MFRRINRWFRPAITLRSGRLMSRVGSVELLDDAQRQRIMAYHADGAAWLQRLPEIAPPDPGGIDSAAALSAYKVGAWPD